MREIFIPMVFIATSACAGSQDYISAGFLPASFPEVTQQERIVLQGEEGVQVPVCWLHYLYGDQSEQRCAAITLDGDLAPVYVETGEPKPTPVTVDNVEGLTAVWIYSPEDDAPECVVSTLDDDHDKPHKGKKKHR